MSMCQKLQEFEAYFICLTSRKGLFDLEKHFAFYGAYHSNPINILIHTLFVWPIFYSSLILFHFTAPILQLPYWFDDHVLDLNVGFVFAMAFGLFYVSMDKKAGSFAAFLCFLCWIGSGCLAARLGFSLAWKVVLVVQLFCWTGQFLGHGIFEKRAPALLDNLPQALVTAPFFVLLEVLKNVCCYEPHPGFHASVQAKIRDTIIEHQTKKEKKMT